MAIPPLFKCPISLDLFTDPVTLCTGQTYDRSSIEKWLAAGNLTCPVTMQKLDDLSMVPNHTLRHLIDQWLQEDSQFCLDYREMINHVDCISVLKHRLDSEDSTLEEKLEIVEKVYILSEELPLQNSCLIQLDIFPLLLEKIFRKVNGSCSEDDLRFSERALACALKLLPFSDLTSLNMLKEEPVLDCFLSLFYRGNVNIKRNLCHIVEVISSSMETQQVSIMLGKSTKLQQELLNLLAETSEASEAGIKAISALSCLETTRENLVREGAVERLIAYILESENYQRKLAPTAIATIERLLVVESAKEVVISNPSCVRALVKMVFRVSDHQGSESAVNSLLALCCDSNHAREEAISAGVLTQLLLLLQSQCSGRTKAKARMLLKLLNSTWVEQPKEAASP
ncbi:U-box domain-containing protein 26-like [Coffea arabica]|uniref:U-box domain-containing protein n=1 Tax=Coffea arabica TaxID=13443 RepID=A0A6P6T747_COFAR|nr:U-box domain-containing protein 26-like isoform X1 [Coffea arabica]XP_027073632.1 U-box domain-containing protein 26-like isoform X1 [Coffea arabica]